MKGYYSIGFFNVVLVKNEDLRRKYDRSLQPKHLLNSFIYPPLKILRWGDVEE